MLLLFFLVGVLADLVLLRKGVLLPLLYVFVDWEKESFSIVLMMHMHIHICIYLLTLFWLLILTKRFQHIVLKIIKCISIPIKVMKFLSNFNKHDTKPF